MCTRYISPRDREIEAFWRIDRRTNQRKDWENLLTVYPMARDVPFVRAQDGLRELVFGQWGFIPSDSATHVPKRKDGKPMNTSNARAEEVHWKYSYRDAWRNGQRCIIPAESFFEPCWETNSHVPWRFKRRDGALWGLAGLWNTWVDPADGVIWESFAMFTINANAHPLMSRMHRPETDKKTKLPLPFEKQDKRSVVPIELSDVDAWLSGSIDDAKKLLRLSPVELFDGRPEVDFA